VMSLGLNIVVGFAGLLDLGYVAFYALGAYSLGWFGSGFFFKAQIHALVSPVASTLPGVHLNFILILIGAALICAAAGAVIGLPTLRLRGDYIAIVTLAFGEIIATLAVNGQSIHIGGGMTGAFFGAYYTTVNAGQFQFGFSIFILAMVIIGGIGSIWGAVVGGLALGYINNYLIPDVLNDLPAKLGFHFQLTQVEFGIFGFLLVIMMVLRPQGLIPERRRQLELTAEIAPADAQLAEAPGTPGGGGA